MTEHVYLNAASGACALGQGVAELESRLFSAEQSPLTQSLEYSATPHYVGKVFGEFAQGTRNNGLIALALAPLKTQVAQLKAAHGASRIGVIIGSSTSGIAEGEQSIASYLSRQQMPAQYGYDKQELFSPAAFVRDQLGVSGPCWAISTACTSGAKAIAAGARLLRTGLCDAVVVGGGDSLCKLTVQGFAALEATSAGIANPFSRHRDGINIGEGSALFVMTKQPGGVRLAGYGETSDAHHISAPHPEGKGAAEAMLAALNNAHLCPADVDYINLHGTATAQNDAAESAAVNRVFGSHIACSSTKPLTGHTLGASGALEALFCWISLQTPHAKLPPHLWDGQADPNIAPLYGLGRPELATPARRIMSNSFAFGGNNISLIFERV